MDFTQLFRGGSAPAGIDIALISAEFRRKLQYFRQMNGQVVGLMQYAHYLDDPDGRQLLASAAFSRFMSLYSVTVSDAACKLFPDRVSSVFSGLMEPNTLSLEAFETLKSIAETGIARLVYGMTGVEVVAIRISLLKVAPHPDH